MTEVKRQVSRAVHRPFAVRRPIFDRHEHVVAYQLLAQEWPAEVFPERDPDETTPEDLAHAWSTMELLSLTGSKKVCVGLPANLLMSGYARGLPAGSAVINLPADMAEPTDVVLHECRRLKKMGHLLALEDPVRRPGLVPFMSLADIVKIPFRTADTKDKYDHLRGAVGDRPRLLAAELDTRDQCTRALELGFSLVQGDFYLAPEIVEGRTIGGSRLNYLKLLEVSNRPDLDIDELNTVIEADLTITHRLLKYLGAAVFGFRTEIRSVRHGLALLGQRRIQAFVSLVALDCICDDKPHELLVTAAVRGRFCERVGKDVVLGDREGELFLLGALSLLDAMLDQPMSDILEQLPLAGDVKRALLGGRSVMQPILQFIRLYERGDWAACTEWAHDHEIVATQARDHYTEAVAWATAALDV